ncbi:MAG: hypothetical protein TRG1_790 [Flavobacteriaceae bacterium FS1-H7996/R]|nr:MAG: hypothetical protein TRG1_790 [Flavobacteriaceae bacterium FS1-H7996/R]
MKLFFLDKLLLTIFEISKNTIDKLAPKFFGCTQDKTKNGK